MLGQIFTKSQKKIQNPAKPARMIALVDETDLVTLPASPDAGSAAKLSLMQRP